MYNCEVITPKTATDRVNIHDIIHNELYAN